MSMGGKSLFMGEIILSQGWKEDFQGWACRLPNIPNGDHMRSCTLMAKTDTVSTLDLLAYIAIHAVHCEDKIISELTQECTFIN